ncbi:DNA repair protein RadA [Patescibacteria group bacterium]|nr:DNA repair protein RadA [Patescibacteria group bacterium]MBU4347025.1 DNA repair protein RadA [Patescibacteria group bacterium]MBU4455544.1 DNA repair protein RadA [Patescibacteria group bacterium]MCG2691188.1 DNA repair protein RadA [Candidatus Parcubacteria bacterium]
MSTKISTVYACANCGAQSLKWSGRCLECGAWGSLQMQTIDQKTTGVSAARISPAEIIDIGEIGDINLNRIKTNISEMDRVLGGGIVPGSLILLGGEPGIGKSTIVAQIADAVIKTRLAQAGEEISPSSEKTKNVIYASGEESLSQIKFRLNRLNCGNKNIKFISETNVEKIIAAIEMAKPVLAIIDSIQTVYTSDLPGEAGSINQIRACAAKLLEAAKRKNIAVIIIGHITKDGAIAGPKSLEHIVDTVIYLETETAHNYRILRAAKNRFGSTNEIGVFEMTDSGFKEIANPAAIFIEDGGKITGSVISAVMEGTRPFLVEIQALVTKTVFGYPQRKASGFDLNRLQVLCAVLTKRAKINLTNQDVILNVVGGLKINEPALDLAVCLAISSSLLNQVIDRKTIVLGEVGLGGEVRNVSRLEQRLAEAEKLGFTKAIIPDCEVKTKKIQLKKVSNINKIIEEI